MTTRFTPFKIVKPCIMHLLPFLLFTVTTAFAQSPGRNYIKVEESLDSSAVHSRFTIQYYDDLGRPDECVTSATRSLYAFSEYDGAGRVSKTWSIVPADGVSYKPQSEIASLAGSAYEDNRPYTTNVYDALNRPVAVTRPGEPWAERPQTTSYAASIAADSVKQYTVTTAGNLSCSGFYAPHSLLCTTTTDEDGIVRKVFTDMQGRKVLERSGGLPHSDTYYVYNRLGQLSFVLSPMFQEAADVSKFAYSYKYDSRGRVTEKTVPGCQKVCYWYDSADRLTCIQDGLLRSLGKYRRYFYDRLERLVIQCVDSQPPSDDTPVTMGFTTAYSNATDYRRYGYTFTGSGNGGTGFSPQIEAVNYYDTYSFLPLYYRIFSSEEIYRLLPQVQSNLYLIYGLPSTLPSGSMQVSSSGEELLETFQYDRKGRMVRDASTRPGGWLTVCTMDYEFSGELKHSTSTYYKTAGNGIPQSVFTATLLNQNDPLHGNRLANSCLVVTDTGNTPDTVIVKTLVYDDWNNVTTTDRDGTAADMTYSYDLLHGWIKAINSTGGFLQKLYREDHSSHPLYNGSISAMTWKVPGNTFLRRYDYSYDGLNRLTEGAYSHQLVLGPFLNNLTGNDPLTLSELGEENLPLDLIPVTGRDLVGPKLPNAVDRYTERIRYDKNSNITSIERYGMNNQHNYGLIDSLEITRNGNQLKAIEDYAEKQLTYTGASDFFDGYTSNNEYSYNVNGALVIDRNRYINQINYDNFGNTRNVIFGNHNQVEYIYAADGTKLRTIHRTVGGSNAYIDSIDYVGNLILKNGQPSMYMFDGGYATFNPNGAVNGWHYYIQDYMGNNRMVVNKNGNVEQVTHYYPYGGIIGDISTNENVQKYKFEGKELDRTFGLDYYDIHARQYFAMAPMWDRIDNKAEEFFHVSPYSFCEGNPVNYCDFNGMNPVFTSDGVYICDTREGFTGSIMIYDGDLNKEELMEMSMGELEGIGGLKWDALLGSGFPELTPQQNEKILNSFLFQLSGQDLFLAYNDACYGGWFSLDQITGSKVQWYPEYTHQVPGVSPGSHFITMRDDYEFWLNKKLIHQYLKGEIYASGNTGWERTVENLACTIVYHEFFGHLKNCDSHFQCYLNSKNCPYFDKATDKYKIFILNKLKDFSTKPL